MPNPGAVLPSWVAHGVKKKADNAFHGPFATQYLDRGMPNTGGRNEIGFINEWAVRYLTTQDDRALEILLQTTHDAGGFPAHWRDEQTGYPAGLDTRPTMEIGYSSVKLFIMLLASPSFRKVKRAVSSEQKKMST